MKNKRLKKALLILSILFFTIPFIDTYLYPLTNTTVTIQSYPKNRSIRNRSIYIIELSNARYLNVKRNIAEHFSPGDTCQIAYSLLQKAILLSYINGENKFMVKIGMLEAVPVLLFFISLLFLLNLLLLFTKIFEPYQASDMGPVLICFFSFLFLLSYLTHD